MIKALTTQKELAEEINIVTGRLVKYALHKVKYILHKVKYPLHLKGSLGEVKV
jgi:hypothetical protein